MTVRVLMTGMSGTGKSSVVRELAARGYHAVDADDGWCVPTPDGRQIWDEDAVEALLSDDAPGVLFFAGCEENMARFLPRFHHVVLLTAPVDVVLERLATRTDNPFGKTAEERHRVLEDLEHIEPRLRAVADHEVQTTGPLADVVAEVLALVGERPVRPADRPLAARSEA